MTRYSKLWLAAFSLSTLAFAGCTNDEDLGGRSAASDGGTPSGDDSDGRPSDASEGGIVHPNDASEGKAFDITGSLGGYDVGATSKSAVAWAFKSRPGVPGDRFEGSVSVSTMADLCAAGAPYQEGHRLLEFLIRRGDRTGKFSAVDFPEGAAEIDPGTIAVVFEDSGRSIVDQPTGTVTVTHFATLPGETTDLTFDVTFGSTGERIKGAVRAPFCKTL